MMVGSICAPRARTLDESDYMSRCRRSGWLQPAKLKCSWIYPSTVINGRWQCRPRSKVAGPYGQVALSRRAAKADCRGAYGGGRAVRDKIPFDVPCTENNIGSFMVRIIKQSWNNKGVFDRHYNLKVVVCVISALCQWLVTPSRDQASHHRRMEQECQRHSAWLMSWLPSGSGMPVPRLGVVSEKLCEHTLLLN